MNIEQKKFQKVVKARRKKEAKERARKHENIRLARRMAEIRRSIKENQRIARLQKNQPKAEQKSGVVGRLKKFFKER